MEATTPTRTPRRTLAALLLPLPLLATGCGGGDGGGDGGPDAWGAPTGAHLVITSENGVSLRPGDDDEVEVDGRVGHRWTHRDDTWVLDLSCEARDGRCPRMPRVDVPAGTPVTVSARDAGIDAAGVRGALDLTTVNGDVTVTRSGTDGAAVRLATRNGSVRATGLRAGDLHAETVNGDVVLACATAPDGVGGTTTNGSVRVALPHDAPAYRVSATTGNGSPTVDVPTAGAADGRVIRLRTVNGDVGATRD
ncbi:DUF4097 family beta strand repeat-containing protein [Streptomyces ziwulingensis]|uniref:DUF4097 domain-containing protein n=1 Tax=Streptomyces ziwulingensis TaxID=1045501 RepID=A0ABP9B2U9_9ACTN